MSDLKNANNKTAAASKKNSRNSTAANCDTNLRNSTAAKCDTNLRNSTAAQCDTNVVESSEIDDVITISKVKLLKLFSAELQRELNSLRSDLCVRFESIEAELKDKVCTLASEVKTLTTLIKKKESEAVSSKKELTAEIVQFRKVVQTVVANQDELSKNVAIKSFSAIVADPDPTAKAMQQSKDFRALQAAAKDREDQKTRECNIVVSGIAPSENDADTFRTFCRDAFDQEFLVASVERLPASKTKNGKKKDQPPELLVKLRAAQNRAAILKEAPKLRNSVAHQNVYIRPDLTPLQAHHLWLMRQKRDEFNKKIVNEDEKLCIFRGDLITRTQAASLKAARASK